MSSPLAVYGEKADKSILSGETQTKLIEKCGFLAGTEVGIWSEVKVKYTNESDDEDTSAFDYTFDYVLIPLGRVKQKEAIAASGQEWCVLQKSAQQQAYFFRT